MITFNGVKKLTMCGIFFSEFQICWDLRLGSVQPTLESRILTEPYMGPDWLFLVGRSELSRKKCQFKTVFFLIRYYCVFSGKIRQFQGLKCALIAPFGWRISMAIIPTYRLGKRTLVLGIRNSTKTGRKPTLLPTLLLRRRLSTCYGVQPQKYH